MGEKPVEGEWMEREGKVIEEQGMMRIAGRCLPVR